MLRVLIVSRDDLASELGRSVLWRPDIDRTVVRDPAEAVPTAARLTPSLVVLDSQDLDGTLALVRLLRADARTRPSAIVVLGRSLSSAIEDRVLAAGANAVVPVPVDEFIWDRRLEELLNVPPRRAQRITVRLRDWSRFVTDAQEMDGAVVNIGGRGALLESAYPLELGTKVGLTFQLPDDPTELQVVAQVVRQAETTSGRFRSGSIGGLMGGRRARPGVLVSWGRLWRGGGALAGFLPAPTGRLKVGGVASDGLGGHRDEPLPGSGPGAGSCVARGCADPAHSQCAGTPQPSPCSATRRISRTGGGLSCGGVERPRWSRILRIES